MFTRERLTFFIQGLNAAGARPRLPLIEKFVTRHNPPFHSKKILSDLKSYPDFVSHQKLDKPLPPAKPAAKKKKKRG